MDSLWIGWWVLVGKEWRAGLGRVGQAGGAGWVAGPGEDWVVGPGGEGTGQMDGLVGWY